MRNNRSRVFKKSRTFFGTGKKALNKELKTKQVGNPEEKSPKKKGSPSRYQPPWKLEKE